MIYSLLADLLLLLHFAFIIFVVIGGLLVFKWRWFAWLHIPAATWGALLEFNSWLCPLTPWEVQLRRLSGEQGYDTGFIEHYLQPLIYPLNLDYNMQVILGGFVIAINLLVYGWLVLNLKRS